VAELLLLMIGRDVVEVRAAVTSVRVGREIGIGQAEIGLVGILIGGAELEFDFLVISGISGAVPAQLGQMVLQIVAGIAAAIDALESMGVLLHGLDQKAELLAGAAGPTMRIPGGVLGGDQ